MEIKKQEGTTCVLMKANCSDEHVDICNMAYIEFTKTDLLKYFDLRNIAEQLRASHGSHGVEYLPVSEGIYWIEEIPEELEELFETLADEEHFTVTPIPEDFLESNDCRTEGTEAHINTYGVLFKAFIKHTSVEVSTWSLSWEMITQLLKNCDPQSVQFIKEDEDHA